MFEGEAGQSTGRYRVERMEPSLSSEVRRADVGSGHKSPAPGARTVLDEAHPTPLPRRSYQ